MSPSNPKAWFSLFLSESSQARTAKRTNFILVMAFLLAAIFLFLALRGLDWSRFFQVFKNARYAWVPLIFAWGSLSYFIRAARWRVLVQSEQSVPLKNVFWANMAGYLGNAILPARAGELVRAGYLGLHTQISSSFILATGLAERLVDLVALIIIGSYALAASGLVSPELQKTLTAMMGVGIFGLAIVLFLPRFGNRLEKLIIWLPFITNTLKTRLIIFFSQFLRGLGALFDFRRATVFGLFTLLIWLMDGLGTVFMGYVLHVPISLLQAFVLLAGLGLSSAIPFTPGYVGVYQFVAVLVLVPFGISRADAVAYILFAQISGFLIVAVWGILALWRISVSQKT